MSQLKAFLQRPVLVYEKKKGFIPMKEVEDVISQVDYTSLNLKEMYEFFQGLYVNEKSGLTRADSLGIIYNQSGNLKIQKISLGLLAEINTGKRFNVAMRRYPYAFAPSIIGIVKSGEDSGDLTEVFKNLLEDIEIKQEILGEVKGALIMPMMVFFTAILVMWAMLTYALPKFIETFRNDGRELPMVTVIVAGISDFLVAHPLAIVFFFAFVFLIKTFFSKTDVGIRIRDKVYINLPLLSKNYILPYQLAMFTNAASLLLNAGLDARTAVKGGMESISNVHLKREVAIMLALMDRGQSFGSTFDYFQSRNEKTGRIDNSSKLFNLSYSSAIKIGERTGTTDEILNTQKTIINSQLKRNMKYLSKTLEPLMILIIALFVLPIIAAIIMPYVSQLKALVDGIETD